MISRLSPEQEQRLEAYRTKMFTLAVSTKTNRKKAEKWALRLVGEEFGQNPEIIWCSSPDQAQKEWDSHPDSLRDSLLDNLQASLYRSLCRSFLDILRDIECDSLYDGLWDTRWIAFYSFPEKEGLVEYSQEDSYRLKCYRKLLKHCFAKIIFPGKIVLVDKPVETKVKDGKLVDIKFG